LVEASLTQCRYGTLPDQTRSCASDTLCHDNGGGSGSGYSDFAFRPATPKSIQCPPRHQAHTIPWLSAPADAHLLALFVVFAYLWTSLAQKHQLVKQTKSYKHESGQRRPIVRGAHSGKSFRAPKRDREPSPSTLLEASPNSCRKFTTEWRYVRDATANQASGCLGRSSAQSSACRGLPHQVDRGERHYGTAHAHGKDRFQSPLADDHSAQDQRKAHNPQHRVEQANV